jgi:hypothetical protein
LIHIDSYWFNVSSLLQGIERAATRCHKAIRAWPEVGYCHFRRKPNSYPPVLQLSRWSPYCCRNPGSGCNWARPGRIGRIWSKNAAEGPSKKIPAVEVSSLVVEVWSTFKPLDFVSLEVCDGGSNVVNINVVNINTSASKATSNNTWKLCALPRPLRPEYPRINCLSAAKPLGPWARAQEQQQTPTPQLAMIHRGLPHGTAIWRHAETIYWYLWELLFMVSALKKIWAFGILDMAPQADLNRDN